MRRLVLVLVLFDISIAHGNDKSYTAKEIEEYVTQNCLNLRTEQDAMDCANKFLKQNQGATFVEDDPYYQKKYKNKVEELKRKQPKNNN